MDEKRASTESQIRPSCTYKDLDFCILELSFRNVDFVFPTPSVERPPSRYLQVCFAQIQLLPMNRENTQIDVTESFASKGMTYYPDYS